MDKYISLEAAHRAINEAPTGYWGSEGHVVYADDAHKQIDAIPAADVRPVVRGSWVNNQELTRFACSSKGMYQCSECKQWINVFQMSGEMNYCPNCGANMREVDTNAHA